MKYRIFGPVQWPPDDFKEDLAAVFRLDDKQRDAIAEWFLSTSSYELYEPSLPPIIVASTLLPEQFRQTAGVIRLLLNSWQRYGRFEFSDIERDLLLLGCGPEQLKILSNLLARLSSVKERVWVHGVEGVHQALGLPTIDDVNIFWDARPVFGAEPYQYFTDAADDASYRRFLGLTYLAIVEIITSDDYGQKQRTAIQMTEEAFKRLLMGMKRASEQLDILKGHTRAITPDDKGSVGG